jgi:hypothetical protein
MQTRMSRPPNSVWDSQSGMRATVLLGILTILTPSVVDAQTPNSGVPAGRAPTFAGQSSAIGTREATPLLHIGNIPVAIWTRVSPPYDVAANRNAAANPLP